MFKKKKLLSLMGLFTLASSTGIVVSTSLNNNLLNIVDQTLETDKVKVESSASEEDKEIVPYDFTYSTPVIVQSTGPIISYGSTITSLDWFGGKRWQINLLDKEYAKYFPNKENSGFIQYTNRAFVNWSFDAKRNKLWLLSNVKKNGDHNNNPQTIIEINSLTGDVIKSIQLDRNLANQKNDGDRVNGSLYRLFYSISALSSGKVLVYGQGNEYWGINYLIDPSNSTMVYNNVDEPENDPNYNNNKILKQQLQQNTRGKTRMLYQIPVSNNRNIAIYADYKENHGSNNATGKLFLALVDDNNLRVADPGTQWNDLVVLENPYQQNEEGWNSSKTNNFSKSFYTTLDGRVYFTAFNKFFVFYPPKNNQDVTYDEYDLKNKTISSFTMDTNENVFLKYQNDGKIYKLNISGTEQGKTNFNLETYYDIESSNVSEIKNNAKNFILFNVYGYTGSIMLLNARITENSSIQEPNSNNGNTSQYGLAAAIIPNKNDDKTGDSLGLLNGPKSFQKSADFQINEEILNNKLPSEITRNDLTLLNGGFITTNPKRDEKGNLLYKPFDLLKIDDEKGTFDITVNIDQVPWFSKTLPTDSIPKTITKSYKNGQDISKKVSWNQNLSYDLKNTLPSKVTLEDLKAFNPFQVSFNSRTVLDSSGNVQYPKITYTTASKDDANGTLVVKAIYEYMPVSQEVNTPKSYTSTHTYNLFKSNDQKHFYFAGSNSEASNNSNTPIDVKSVPQLKELSESNLLPSSFANQSNQNSFLQFINTNKSTGYPISKMNFEFEPDDLNGTLTVKATMPSSYYGVENVFRQTYTGLNKKTEYNFTFSDVQRIDGSSISIMLPSSISEGDIISNFIKYSGFNSNDFEIILIPNNENGTLTVQVKLDKSYPSEIGNKSPFSNYLATKTYSGFMTTESFNNQYQVSFKDNSNASLVELKKLTIQSIDDSLTNKNSSPNNKGLTINGTTYTSWDDLAEKLLVESKGSKIPGGWQTLKDKSQLETKVSYNNESGTLNISVKIKKEALNGYQSDLNFVQSYDGFAKGNKVITEDSLSFISNDLLKTTVDQVKNMNAIEMKNWLDDNKQNINHLILSKTGQYVELINSNNFQLETSVNETYNTISIKIVFENLTNTSSLKEYSIQYKLN